MSRAARTTGQPRQPEPASATDRLVVGRVRAVHGLRGALRVEVLTDQPEKRFERGAVLHLEGSAEHLTVIQAGPDKPGWLVRFAEIPDRDAADRMRDRYLEAEIPGEPSGPDSYYWHEIVGAPVADLQGQPIGEVVDVYRAGGAEVYLVRGEPYGEFDLPAVRPLVVSFEPRGARIVIDPQALGLEPAKARAARKPKSRGRRQPG